MNNNTIILERAGKSYIKGLWAVKDISFRVEKSEFFSLVGPSGSGKTTVLRLIAGLEVPTTGTIAKPNSIAMVFQSGALLPWLTVEENVAFPLRLKNPQKEAIQKTVEKYIEMVGLGSFAQKYPRELSGGQRQRVGIARALAVEPEVLLLDEPFSALDPITTDELHRDLLSIWQKTKKTIIMVSHSLEEAVFLSDRIGVMQNGEIKKVVGIDLPRPRKIDSEIFEKKCAGLRELLEN